ncbi:hypothetical protein [Streptomyces sp. ODS28]|uniref:hypothetical protein n=1 Tax=Streptomyces sp. ODS28 TaxID=3136688 RepID=UPI0031F08CB5
MEPFEASTNGARLWGAYWLEPALSETERTPPPRPRQEPFSQGTGESRLAWILREVMVCVSAGIMLAAAVMVVLR